MLVLGWWSQSWADERCDRAFDGVDAIVLVGLFVYEDGCVGTGYTVDGVSIPDRTDAAHALELLDWSSPESRRQAAMRWATGALHDGAVVRDLDVLLAAAPAWSGPRSSAAARAARRTLPTSAVPTARDEPDGSVVVSFWSARSLVNQGTSPWSGYTLYQWLEVRFAPTGRAEVQVLAERVKTSGGSRR